MSPPGASSKHARSRRRTVFLTLAVLTPGLAGCGSVLSIAPVVPRSASVPLPQLVGTWRAEDGSRATVSAPRNGVYAVAVVDSDGTREEYLARAGRLGGRLVLDIWSAPPGPGEAGGYPGTLIAGHLLAVVDLEGDELRAAQLKGDSLTAAVQRGDLRTPFLDLGNGPVLTGPTDSLRAALGPYLDHKGVLEKPARFLRRPAASDSGAAPPPRPGRR